MPPRLTKHRAGRDGLPVEPEGDLGQDDSHDAGQVGLDHKVPNLPLEVEVRGHDDVFPCRDSQGGLLSFPAQLGTPEVCPEQTSRFFSGISGCSRRSQLLCHARCVPWGLSHHICLFKTLL